MLERFGDQAIAGMLAAYANNLTTPEALQQAFGVSQQEFEAGYGKFVEKVVAALPAGGKPRELSPAEVQQALAKNPKDPELLARMAFLQLGRKSYPAARRSADAALAADPKNGLAHYVRARLHLLVGENSEALARLEGALDREHPDQHVLGLLAGLKLKAEDYPAAAELYELGARHHPDESKWDKSLAAVYLRAGDDKKLAAVLERLAAADPDELTVRKKLASLAIDAKDWSGVERWTRETLQIDVRDVEIHDWRAQALAASDKPAQAAEEYAVAVELDPEQPQLRIAMAQARLKAGQTQQAKDALKELLEGDPQNTTAAELLKGIP
jgi:predicted Zn-dependent protease